MFSNKQQVIVAVVMFLAGLFMAVLLVQTSQRQPYSDTPLTARQAPIQGEGLAGTVPPARPSPALFEGPDGKDVSLDDFKGRWLVVNFWATWCPPCIQEMPAFARMLEAMGDQAPQFVAISVDAMGRGAAEPFAQSKGWTHVKAYADARSDLYRTFQSPGIPLTIVIDPEGREVARRLGPAQWDGELVMGQMKRLMADGKLE